MVHQVWIKPSLYPCSRWVYVPIMYTPTLPQFLVQSLF